MDQKTRSVSYRGLTTVSWSQTVSLDPVIKSRDDNNLFYAIF
ncbi:MAG: palindromic element RPE4 domain-containing protein [Rickettsia endosymbiont of Haemaphysalis japonica]